LENWPEGFDGEKSCWIKKNHWTDKISQEIQEDGEANGVE
jgi:hypothetical protein